MKHALLAGVLALTLPSTACRSLRTVEVPVEAQVELPGRTLLDDLLGVFSMDSQDFDFKQAYANTQYTPDQADAVFITDFRIKAMAPQDQDLSFFGAVRVILRAEGLEEITLAEASSFPPGSREVVFSHTDEDLRDYLLAPEYEIEVQVEDSERPPQDTVIKIKAAFDVIVSTDALL